VISSLLQYVQAAAVQKRGLIDDIKTAAEKTAQDVQKKVADAVAEVSLLWEGVTSKVSDVISSATATLKAKAQEVKDKIQEVVSAAEQIGRNIGPCISEQSEAADSVLKLAGTASRRFYEPFTVRSHSFLKTPHNSRQFFS
jgi:methyl-accepting chemotaxis protein